MGKVSADMVMASIETASAGPAGSGWGRTALALALALAVALVLFHETAWSIVDTWRRSETFTHGFLILPIVAWLIWQRRHAVAALEPRIDVWALPVLAVAGFAWLLGHVGSVWVVQQYALVVMLVGLVWLLAGRRVVWTLLFPLAFLLFAVPFGDFLVPLLMIYTADFTVAMVQITGIPVYREGMFISLPTGNWSVVEACSGIRYLIASVTLGCLYAYLMYRSVTRRVVFVLASAIVPIIANGLRAYMIVMIGHLSGMELAVGVDHLLYGWVFFGIVIGLMFWIGAYWREDGQPHPQMTAPRARAAAQGPLKLPAVALAAVALLAVWPAYGAYVHNQTAALPEPELRAPVLGDSWQPMDEPITHWRPGYQDPRSEFHRSYIGDGHPAGIHVAYYQDQLRGTEMINWVHRIVERGDDRWQQVSDTRRVMDTGSNRVRVRETRVRGNGQRLLVWHWYWVDGRMTTSPSTVKFRETLGRLTGRGDAAALVVLYAPYRDHPSEAEAVLEGFARDAVNPLMQELGRAADH